MEQNSNAPTAQVNIPLTYKKRMAVTIAALVALFLYMYTICSFAVAQPKIIADLGGMVYYTLTVTLFALSSAITRPIAGKLGDIYGRKSIMNAALIIFVIGSVCCGASSNIYMLLLSRVAEGIGAGFIGVNVSVIIGDIWEPKARAKVLGIQGTITSLAVILGPIIGGVLADDVSWRYVFFVGLPLAIIPFIICNAVLPKTERKENRAKIDVLGSILLVLTTVPLLLAITWGGTQYKWTSPIILGMFAATVVFGILFINVEKKTPEPVLAVDLLKIPTYRMVCLVGMCTFIFTQTLTAYFPLYGQAVRGLTATQSGLFLMPVNVMAMIVSTVVGMLLAKSGKYVESMFVCAAFAAVCMFVLGTFNATTSTVFMIIVLIVCGVPNAMSNVVFYNAAQSAVPSNKIGSATGTLMFFCGLIVSVGMSILGAVINSMYNIGIVKSVLPMDIQQAIGEKNLASMATTKFLMGQSAANKLKDTLPPDLQDKFSQAISTLRAGLGSGLSRAFILTGILATVGCILGIIAIRMKKAAAAAASTEKGE